MKKRMGKLLSIVICVGILFSLTGCKLEHYTRQEAIDWFREEVADVPVKVSKEYLERASEESSYKDHVWTARLLVLPELEFELISHETWGMETITHYMQTTFHSVLGHHYFENYPMEEKSLLTEKQERPTSFFGVGSIYHNRAEIRDAIQQAQRFTDYVQEQEVPCVVSFTFSYDDPLAKVDGDSDTRFTASTDGSGLKGDLLVQAERLFAQYAADYRIAVDQFTTKELADAVSYYDSGFTLYRNDGSSVVYSDLSLSRFGYGLSFGCLYEVLRREGIAVNGNPQAFQFTGTDGSQYAFSYAYNDEPFEIAGERVTGYYYIKDGKQIPMEAYFYNHITSSLLQEMTGLFYAEAGEEPSSPPLQELPQEMGTARG